MTRQKAEKHLKRALEHREYLRSSYVERMRDPNWRRLDSDGWVGGNPFQEWMTDIKKDLKEINERISKFERIVK